MKAKGFFTKRCPVHETVLRIRNTGLGYTYACPTCESIYLELTRKGLSHEDAKRIAQGGRK